MKSILLADDEPMLLTSMMEIDWASVGIDHVYTAGSGIEAVQLLETNAIDVVVTDIRMPGMSGLDVCAYVQEHCPRTRCIILSGYSDFKYAQQAIHTKAVNYLLKPVQDAELVAVVTLTLNSIAQEWEAVSSAERATQTLRQNLPLLRSNLLNDLFSGSHYSEPAIAEKLRMYDVRISREDPFYMLMIRLEKWYLESNSDELSLYEFSVMNIVNELMQEEYDLWSCRDSLGYLVWLIKPKQQGKEKDSLLGKLAKQVQACINSYLRGEVSVLLSFKERFSKKEIVSVYRMLLSQFRKLPRSDHGFFIRLEQGAIDHHVLPLPQLYQPPTVMQLLEAGRFQDARNKILHVFEELRMKKLDDQEHILEVTSSFYSAFSYMAHLQGVSIVDLAGEETGGNFDYSMFTGSISTISEWFLSMLDRLESLVDKEAKDAHANLVHKVLYFIEENISVDISLQAIGDHVHLHPAYLSGVYKQLTGENISDYIYRHRMEKSGYLLRSTDIKVYELAQQLGFQNAPYFSKLFKSHHGMTPQEYREKYRLAKI